MGFPRDPPSSGRGIGNKTAESGIAERIMRLPRVEAALQARPPSLFPVSRLFADKFLRISSVIGKALAARSGRHGDAEEFTGLGVVDAIDCVVFDVEEPQTNLGVVDCSAELVV